MGSTRLWAGLANIYHIYIYGVAGFEVLAVSSVAVSGSYDDHDHDDAAAAAQHVIDKKRHWGLWWLVAVGSVRNGSSMAGHGCLTLAV